MANRKEKTFADYRPDGHLWITLSTGEYYPDILPLACELYKPVLVTFGQLLKSAHSSTDLFKAIAETKPHWKLPDPSVQAKISCSASCLRAIPSLTGRSISF